MKQKFPGSSSGSSSAALSGARVQVETGALLAGTTGDVSAGSGTALYLKPHTSNRIWLPPTATPAGALQEVTIPAGGLNLWGGALTASKAYDVFLTRASATTVAATFRPWNGPSSARVDAISRIDNFNGNWGHASYGVVVATIVTDGAGTPVDSVQQRFCFNFFNRVRKYLWSNRGGAQWAEAGGAYHAIDAGAAWGKFEWIAALENVHAGAMLNLVAKMKRDGTAANAEASIGWGLNLSSLNALSTESRLVTVAGDLAKAQDCEINARPDDGTMGLTFAQLVCRVDVGAPLFNAVARVTGFIDT